jgi:hypothetical protein
MLVVGATAAAAAKMTSFLPNHWKARSRSCRKRIRRQRRQWQKWSNLWCFLSFKMP